MWIVEAVRFGRAPGALKDIQPVLNKCDVVSSSAVFLTFTAALPWQIIGTHAQQLQMIAETLV